MSSGTARSSMVSNTPVTVGSYQFKSRFTVTKSSWRGKYTRILCIGEAGVGTADPKNLSKVTNFWSYEGSLRDTSVPPPSDSTSSFHLHCQSGSKVDVISFLCSSDAERAMILTEINRYRTSFDYGFRSAADQHLFSATKFTSHNTPRLCTLRVTAVGVEQLAPSSSSQHGGSGTAFHKQGDYLYCQIRGLTTISGEANRIVIAYGAEMKLHCFDVLQVGELREFIERYAPRFVGMPAYREMKPLSQTQFDSDRLGFRHEALEAVAEFSVLKASAKHPEGPARRLLSTTPVALVERDATSYNVMSCHFLSYVHVLVRCDDDDQQFMIFFREPPVVKCYTSPLRDAILAHLMSACHLCGNSTVAVVPRSPIRSYRLSSLRCRVTEEMESALLHLLAGGATTAEAGSLAVPSNVGDGSSSYGMLLALELFNANVDYTGLRSSENREGLFAENREKLIFCALDSTLQQLSLLLAGPVEIEPYTLTQYFLTLRRLVVSRTGFSCVAVIPSVFKMVATTAVQALRQSNVSLAHAVVDFLCALVTPFHNQYEIEHESLNKNRLIGAQGFTFSLLEMLRDHIHNESASLLVLSLLSLFVYTLCPPYSETTESSTFERVLKDLVEVVGSHLYHLLTHPCDAIRYHAGQLIRVVMEEGSEEQFIRMQQLALSEGGVLSQFNTAVSSKNRALRDLARRLLTYWAFRCTPTQDLLRRMLPLTLLNFLQSTEKAPSEEEEEEVTKAVSQMTAGQRESKNGWFRKSFQPRDLVPQRAPQPRPRVALPLAGGGTAAPQPQEGPPTSVVGAEESAPAPATPPVEVVEAAASVEKPASGSDAASGVPSPPPPPAAPENPQGDTALHGEQDLNSGCVWFRTRHVRISPGLNWNKLFYELKQNHYRPDLIWNHTTRDELRAAVEAELEAFRQGVDLRQEKAIAWNYQEFEVVYHSLDTELKIGHHYPRLLFEEAHPTISRPLEFFNDMYHRFLLVADEKSKLECLHGMSLLYKHYAEAIGEFNDLPFLLRMLQDTVNPCMRDRLLLLFAELLRARHNIKLFLDHDGVTLLMQMVTLAHLHIDRPQNKTASNTIEYGGKLEALQGQEKEWHYSTGTGSKPDPVSYTRLKEMYAAGEVTGKTKVWAQGMAAWRELSNVPQLRWGIVAAKEASILTLTEVTCVVLDILIRACAYYPSVNESGAVMQPIPRIKRRLSAPHTLPHLVQLLLTFDSAVCSRIHTLLFSLMEENPLVGRFFLTGVFFFALMYFSSDVAPMCRLLALTHRKQSFQYSASKNELVRDSILAPLLPPAMICYLTHHGAEKFAEIFLGDYNNPEAIWSPAMRQYLGGQIANHIADFTPRLLGNNTAVYQYCPLVGLRYEALERELFCSQYYLRHLCDEAQFPQWPIRQPVHFLGDVLRQWQQELNKKPGSGISRDECLAVLELPVGGGTVPTVQAIRKAYFTLANKYHPDKNPDGREMFQRVQQAYEHLFSPDSGKEDAPDPHNIALLLKAQSILYKRCGEVLREYKYAGYGLLLKLVKTELLSGEALHREVVLLEPATELSYFTILNAPLNADELQEEGGIALLGQVARYCFDLITPNSTDDLAHVKIAKHCMLTFSISAQFADCRVKMLADPHIPYMTARGMAYTRCTELSRACIEACATEARGQKMQNDLIAYGSMWHLLRQLFFYDATVQMSEVALSEKHHQQLFLNRASLFALQALFSLAGLAAGSNKLGKDPLTTRHRGLRELLCRLLTPYAVSRMEDSSDAEALADTEILSILNSNSETPYFLWNNACRAELEELLQTYSDTCREAAFGAEDLPGCNSCDTFTYALHKSEVIVGGVFLRIYVSQPTFPILAPIEFFEELVKFLQQLEKTAKGVEQDVFLLPMTCLHIVADKYTDLVNAVARRYMPVLLGLLGNGLLRDDSVAHLASVLDRLASSEACLDAMAAVSSCTGMLFLALHHVREPCRLAMMALVRRAVLHRGIVSQVLEGGLYVELLYIYATSSLEGLSEECCQILSKCMADRLVGPKVVRRCTRYLPGAFVDMIRDSPAQAARMLDSWQQNPELLWTKEQKQSAITHLQLARDSIVAQLEKDPASVWAQDDEAGAGADGAERVEDLQLGGVYVSLYVKQPGWTVRKPKEFLMALLDRYCQEAESAVPLNEQRILRLERITEAGELLLRNSPGLRDYMASLGYGPRLVRLLQQKPVAAEEVVGTALHWLNQVATSSACVEAISTAGDPLEPLMSVANREDKHLVPALKALEAFIANGTPRANLLAVAMRDSLPEFILSSFEGGLPDRASGVAGVTPAHLRALLVKLMKAMLQKQDPVNGPRLQEFLSHSPIWAKYKEQSYDMFLTQAPVGGYLTSSAAPHGMLSLTTSGGVLGGANMVIDMNDEPPPLDPSASPPRP